MHQAYQLYFILSGILSTISDPHQVQDLNHEDIDTITNILQSTLDSIKSLPSSPFNDSLKNFSQQHIINFKKFNPIIDY